MRIRLRRKDIQTRERGEGSGIGGPSTGVGDKRPAGLFPRAAASRARTSPLVPVVVAAALCACGAADVSYRPAPQILPPNIKRIAVRLVQNKTQQFGMEDKLTRAVLDAFLKDGTYGIVQESDADGVVVLTITRYILTPVQYDNVLTPTSYKLIILTNLQFIDRTKNAILWEEPNFQGTLLFSASTLPGGLTEEQAREQIYDQLSRDVVKRVVQGFGAVTGTSQRAISNERPPTEGAPVLPPKPVNPNPY